MPYSIKLDNTPVKEVVFYNDGVVVETTLDNKVVLPLEAKLFEVVEFNIVKFQYLADIVDSWDGEFFCDELSPDDFTKPSKFVVMPKGPYSLGMINAMDYPVGELNPIFVLERGFNKGTMDGNELKELLLKD